MPFRFPCSDNHSTLATGTQPLVVLCTGDEDGILVDDILKEDFVNPTVIDAKGNELYNKIQI